jgi:hypothetical protein
VEARVFPCGLLDWRTNLSLFFREETLNEQALRRLLADVLFPGAASRCGSGRSGAGEQMSDQRNDRKDQQHVDQETRDVKKYEPTRPQNQKKNC